MIAHYYEKREGFYFLQVSSSREYRIKKINSHKWEWSEWRKVGNTFVMLQNDFKRTFKTCVMYVDLDASGKHLEKGYPPRDPHTESRLPYKHSF